MDYSIYEENRLSFSKYLAKCFMFMFLGLTLSFATAAIFSYTNLFYNILMDMGTSFLLLSGIVELVLVISLSLMVTKLSSKTALTLFFIYSIVSGVTLSSIFYVYDLTSIIYVFIATGAIFGIMSIVGYTTKLDLSKLGTFIPLALLLLLITGIILMFSFSETAYIVYSVAGIAIFMLITTYDIHIIKRMYYSANSLSEQNSLAIYGALQLYLDFIYIFLRLLALFAKNRD